MRIGKPRHRDEEHGRWGLHLHHRRKEMIPFGGKGRATQPPVSWPWCYASPSSAGSRPRERGTEGRQTSMSFQQQLQAPSRRPSGTEGAIVLPSLAESGAGKEKKKKGRWGEPRRAAAVAVAGRVPAGAVGRSQPPRAGQQRTVGRNGLGLGFGRFGSVLTRPMDARDRLMLIRRPAAFRAPSVLRWAVSGWACRASGGWCLPHRGAQRVKKAVGRVRLRAE
jgi:hypothetical protein